MNASERYGGLDAVGRDAAAGVRDAGGGRVVGMRVLGRSGIPDAPIRWASAIAAPGTCAEAIVVGRSDAVREVVLPLPSPAGIGLAP